MTSIRFLMICTLAISVTACGEPLDPGTGTGGTGGTGGTDGGPTTDLCVNAADMMAIEDHTNEDLTGVEAVAQTGQDCVLTTECIPFAAGALQLDEEAIENLAECVGACIGEMVGVSSGCETCYGDTVACGASACGVLCSCLAAGNCGDEIFDCNTCLNNNCVPAFNTCSGFDDTLPES